MLTVVLIYKFFFLNITAPLLEFVVGETMYIGKAFHMEQFHSSGISTWLLQFATDGAWLDKEPVTVSVFTIVLRSFPIITWR